MSCFLDKDILSCFLVIKTRKHSYGQVPLEQSIHHCRLVLIGLAAAFAISRVPLEIKNEPGFVIGYGILWTVFGLAVAYTAWSREDEAQREAHKSAWYHGGLAGSLVCLIPMAWAARLGDRTAFLAPERFSSVEPLTLVLYGAFILFAFQSAGMLIAWLVWWNSKR